MAVSSAPQVESKEENRSCTINGTVREENPVENRVKVTVGNASKACMYLRVNITNNPVNMLIDTGSPFSIITKELAEILGVEIQHTHVDLSSPDGREITVYGKADVDLDILGQKIGQEFLVANLDKVNLLGIDFLEKMNAEININKQTLKTSLGRFKLFRNKTTIVVPEFKFLRLSQSLPSQNIFFKRG